MAKDAAIERRLIAIEIRLSTVESRILTKGELYRGLVVLTGVQTVIVALLLAMFRFAA